MRFCQQTEAKIRSELRVGFFIFLEILLDVESADGTLGVAFEPRLEALVVKVVPTRQEARYLPVLVILQAKHARLVRLADSPFSEFLHELFVNTFAVLQYLVQLISARQLSHAQSRCLSCGCRDAAQAPRLRPIGFPG